MLTKGQVDRRVCLYARGTLGNVARCASLLVVVVLASARQGCCNGVVVIDLLWLQAEYTSHLRIDNVSTCKYTLQRLRVPSTAGGKCSAIK
jgi:hypothetical protein